jgi:hypothetical protein
MILYIWAVILIYRYMYKHSKKYDKRHRNQRIRTKKER